MKLFCDEQNEKEFLRSVVRRSERSPLYTFKKKLMILQFGIKVDFHNQPENRFLAEWYENKSTRNLEDR